MNILFVSSFPIEPITGGVQRVTSILADEFQRLGFSVHCLVLQKAEHEIDYSIKHHFLPENGLNSMINKKFYWNLLRQLRIDVIINQAGIYKEVVDFVSDKKSKTIKLITVHHNCIQCLRENLKNILLGGSYGKLLRVIGNKIVWSILLYNNKRKYAFNFKNAIDKSDKLVLLSENYKNELKTYLTHLPAEKVVAISNPLSFDVQNLDLSKKENRLVYVGRVEYSQKQAHLLIPIWKEISKKFPDWHVDIVGDGMYLPQLKQEAQDNQLSNINFHGYQDPKPFLEKAKIFLMTSSFEGYGMVLVEAQAYGVIPIAFNSFPILQTMLLNFEAGVGVTPFDVGDYVEKLYTLMKEDNIRETMVFKGYEAALRFIPTKIAKDWVDLM